MTTSNDTTKTCTKCQQPLPATREYFPPQRKGSNKLHSWCLQCHREHTRQRRKDPAVIMHNRAYDRQRSKTPEVQERKKKQRKEREQRPEVRQRLNEYNRKYYHEHPSEKRRRRIYNTKRWQNPATRAIRKAYEKRRNETVKHKRIEKIRIHNRRAKVRQLPHTMTMQSYQRMMEYWHHACAVCGKTADFWIAIAQDHWIPLSDPHCPGTVPTNIIPLCHSMPGNPAGHVGCNNSKTNKDPHEWLVQQYGERRAVEIEKKIQAYFDWVIPNV